MLCGGAAFQGLTAWACPIGDTDCTSPLSTGTEQLDDTIPLSLLTAGPGAYAALIGLTVGALATPHGSVATMIARDLAGEGGGLPPTTLAPAAGSSRWNSS